MVTNALTFDIEDWYQGLTSTSENIEQWANFESRVEKNSEFILDKLTTANIKATFFILGYVAEHCPRLIKTISGEGHEIGLHGYYHRKVNQLRSDQFIRDIQKTLLIVEETSGKKVVGFRAPMFSIDRDSMWALEVLKDMGFRYDSSVYPIRNRYYGAPDAPRFAYRPFKNHGFYEIPVSTTRIFGKNWPVGGGFYFRAIPYPLFRHEINRLNNQGKPAVLYFHPWEFDLEQPYQKVTLREKVTHFYGRKGLEGKFTQLLKDFKFGPVSELIKNLN